MSDPDDPQWTQAAILRRLGVDGDMTDNQRAVLTKAIRNPDAPMGTIAAVADVTPTVLTNCLQRVRRGGYEADDDYNPRVDDDLGDDAYAERTLKQRAAIDWLARHPNARDVLTSEQASDASSDETGVPLHWATLNGAERKYGHLIQRRRELLPAGEIQPLSESDREDRRRDPNPDKSARPRLAEAGVEELPDQNLDGLPTADEVLEAGARRGREKMEELVENGERKPPSAHLPSTDGESDAAQAESGAESDAGGGEGPQAPEEPRTRTREGNRSYEGPETGLNLAGDAAPSVLVDRGGDDLSESTADALERLHDEVGQFGERAHEMEIELDGKDDLRHHLRVLHVLVSEQGKRLQAYEQVLDNLNINVEVTYGGDDE